MFTVTSAFNQFFTMEIDEQLFIVKFGKHLRQIRFENNLSQEMLANDANIPINQIGRIERAEISTSLSTLYKIAKALNISVKHLLDFE